MTQRRGLARAAAVAALSTALLAACGQDEGATISMTGDDYMRVAASIVRGEERVTADQLARWLAEERRDFVVVDIRPASAFGAGHVRGALNLPLPVLVSDEGRRQLPFRKNVVVYADEGETAAEAAVMLRLAGIRASFLVGGYPHWSRYVLNPSADEQRSAWDGLTFPERRVLANVFLGKESPAAAFTPAVTPVASVPVDAPRRVGKAIVSEGC